MTLSCWFRSLLGWNSYELGAIVVQALKLMVLGVNRVMIMSKRTMEVMGEAMV